MDSTLINLVSKHLVKHRRITSMQAFDLYGATRLSAIIYVLRGKGYPIITTMKEGVNRYGNPVRYGEYSLPKGWKLADLKK